MQVVATPASLRRIRHELATARPDIKHSHLTEALASALGFGTNAALISWMGEHPRDTPALRTVDPANFTIRLDELHAPVVPGHVGDLLLQIELARAIVTVDAAADAPGYDEISPGRLMVSKKHWPEFPTKLPPAAGFAGAMAMLDNRLEHPDGDILEFVRNEGSHRDLHLKIAAGAQRHEDADPEMAGFLCDWMLYAEWARELDAIAGSVSAWGAPIYRVFRPRILAFRDAVCRRWADDTDSLELPTPARPAMPKPPRCAWGAPVRYAGIHVTAAPGHTAEAVGAFDAGRPEFEEWMAGGLAGFALWRAGVSKAELNDFSQHAKTDARSWVTVEE